VGENGSHDQRSARVPAQILNADRYTGIGSGKMANRKPIPREVMFECIMRDNGICQKCHAPLIGKDSSSHSPQIEFHHIKTVLNGGDDSTSNLIILCHECHMKEHGFNPSVKIRKASLGIGYRVVGSKKQGHRIAVPESTGPQSDDRYNFICGVDITPEDLPLPEGSLVYVPAPRPTSKREKTGVSG